jgi:GT2 family glycosyltransferase
LSANDSYPQHVVTAVIVAHDGATWLPHVIDSLLEQTRPVQRVVAVDTGSRDRSGTVLAGKLGEAVVFGMDRGTGYAAAVTRALQHKAANVSVPGATGVPHSERAEWIWLLHDDCEPAPDALEQLLRGAAETRAAAVLGPKVKDWADHDVIIEAGVTIDTVGRRVTGIEPREVDQGQHDGDRDALAVGSAGMLIRRDVWDEVGGFDTGMALFMEDIDFCWRAHSEGYRVRVITDAVVYHAQASARNRRPISVGRRARMLDRRNALLTLLGNLPTRQMLAALVGNAAISALRTIFFLVAKRPAAALDEFGAVTSVLGHPLRLLKARRRRSRGRRSAYGRLRADLPRGRSLRRLAEFAATATSRSTQLDTAGSHHATDDPLDDDSLLTDVGLAQRILSSPGVLLFLALTVIAIVAERSLIGSGPLGGGSLVPAWGGASDLWHDYLQGFHPAGVGSGSSAPPYLAVVAALATVLGGKPWLAIDVILLGCVPLAGVFAYLAVRRVTRLVAVRVWAAATYALLPVAMGTIAAGRIGTAVVFVLLPLIALLAGRMLSQPPRRARRAAWATGLLIAIGTAFVPLLWGIAAIAAAMAALAFRKARPDSLLNLVIVVLVPPVLLLPWTIQLVARPAGFLLEAGLQQPGLATRGLPARSLLLLSPGGPGLPAVWVTAGLALAALAALLVSRRRVLTMAGWAIALLGLLVAIAVSRVQITPAAGGRAITVWPGAALAVAAVGFLVAAVAAGDALSWPADGRSRGIRGIASPRIAWVALVAIVACSAPVLAAAFWLSTGVKGPVAPARGQTVPEIVSVSTGNGLQLRTLVLRSTGSQVSYSLLRGSSPSLADPDLVASAPAEQALSTAVAALVGPGGGRAVNQGQALARLDIGFVLMQAPVNQGLARVLDGVAGLRPVSTTPTFALWKLSSPPARVQVAEPDGSVVPVSSGPVSVSGAAAPAAGGTLELAEPAGGWSATLNGRPLTAVPSPAGSWAQAFRLPPGGGTLDISHSGLGRELAIVLELLAIAVVAVLALPGVRTAAEDSQTGAGADHEPARVAAAKPARAEGSHGQGRPGSRSRARGRRPRKDKDKDGPTGPRRSRSQVAPKRVAAAAGWQAAAAAGQLGDRPAAPAAAAPRAGDPAVRPLAQQPPSGPWAYPQEPAAGSPPRPAGIPSYAEQPSGWPSAGQSAWSTQQPSAEQQPAWSTQQPSAEQESAWYAQQPSGWPAADQSPGWSAGEEQPGWPSGHEDALEPLPSAGDMRPDWPRPSDDELPTRHWSGPDQGAEEGEGW